MSQSHWGWLVAIYLFLGGMGAGCFLVSAAVEWTGERYKHAFCPTTLVGATVPGPLIAIGTVLLIFDLGAGKMEPWRIFYMFTHFSSAMTWGIWILTLFIPLCFLYGLVELMHVYPGILAWARRWLRFLPETLPYRRIKRILCPVGSILAVGTAVYTGVLLSVVRAIPFWNSPVLPFLFLVSALSTGMGLNIDLSGTIAVGPMERRFRNLPLYHMLFIGGEALLIGLLLLLAFLRGGAAAQSAQMIVAGPMSLVFWVLVVFFGLLIPFLFHAYAYGARQHSLVGGILSGAGIVIAGLFLRYLIVASGIHVAL
ncbi:MAG: NrfD/PsrC family molybdoenzyme membrane anchor subunit [Anaerolineae bacterium]